MITINGVLTVKQISGANGKFCTGDLNTSIGEFKVKESILDQFEEGRYEGEFVIERFYLTSYVWRGKSTTDIRAKVTDIRLDTADEGVVDNSMPEPDPVNEDIVADSIDEKKANLDTENIAESKAVATDEYKLTDDVAKDYENLVSIVGVELVSQLANNLPVKLDPTVDRALFRQQRDVLKAHGYQFDALSQSWTKSVGHVG
jgi:hypothetical protein